MPATPKEVRQARAFLQARGIKTSDISPKLFAGTAKKLGKSFVEVLKRIAELQTQGQHGESQSPIAEKLLSKRQKEAIDEI